MGERQISLEKTILIVPLVVAFAWMGFSVFNFQFNATGERLAPSQLDGLVTALFIFIILYAIVLVFLFYKMNKEFSDIKAPVKAAAPATIAIEAKGTIKDTAPDTEIQEAAAPKVKKSASAKKPAKKAKKRKK